VRQQDTVKVVARLVSGQEVGRYDFADCNRDGVRDVCELSCLSPGCTGVAGCGTARDTSPADGLLDDCPGNLHALKVRCESTPDGIAPAGNAAVLNPANPAIVRILLSTGTGPEKFVRNLLVSERGKIRRIALFVLNAFAHRNLAQCRSGPGVGPQGSTCTEELFAAGDYDEDGDVDLRDFAFIQNNFVPN